MIELYRICDVPFEHTVRRAAGSLMMFESLKAARMSKAVSDFVDGTVKIQRLAVTAERGLFWEDV